ncbi:MAG: Gfo/Idh/MocA family oxidoreductase [Burkholderiaceae bacterium]|nr:Gfo/Idh/MocA family oxidoreductase [Microbacteriaceae bacterium]
MGRWPHLRQHRRPQRGRAREHHRTHHHQKGTPVGQPLNVGIIGCGKIIAQYLETFARLDDVRLVAVADLDESRAREVADSVPGTLALSVDGLLAAEDIDVVVNLTVPAAHAAVSLRIIAAGKSVYVEKPLAATTAEAREVLDAATSARKIVGCAPDTVLGTGIQTARRAIDDGLIGAPVSATATMVTPGHERWHPNPDFYYLPGGGPLLDMGPYYVTALVTLLGPIARVMGAASATRSTRTIQSGPREGEVIPVSTPTHVTGILVHESGVISTLVTSFDATATTAANIEVHGQTGTLGVPDPNHFSGDVRLWALGDDQWRTLPVSAGYSQAARGYGITDMLRSGDGLVESRASGELAFHVLDVMESLLRSAEAFESVVIGSTVQRPEAVPLSGD